MGHNYYNNNLFNWEPIYFKNEGYVATREVLFEKYKPLKIIITSTPIGIGTRRLRATWTPELAIDVAAFHSIDAEEELTELLKTNHVNKQTRHVIVEKWKPNTEINLWGSKTWTTQFREDFYSLWAPPE
jgi:hypothetical protein